MEHIVRELADQINAVNQKGTPFIIAIDGRCAAGKTTLAERLCGVLDCVVFHMDDFFLRREQRTKERLETPGGNVDYERFLEEIILPIKNGAGEISYRPYSCHKQDFLKTVTVRMAKVVIIEGSYSCHPALAGHYDLRVFLSVDREKQLSRIIGRNGTNFRDFLERWIPLEERYFEACSVKEQCELCFVSDDI